MTVAIVWHHGMAKDCGEGATGESGGDEPFSQNIEYVYMTS